MPQYLHPGVYVEEVPSAVKPIAGVGTSTAAFIGVFNGPLTVPGDFILNESVGTGDGTVKNFNLARYPVQTTGATVRVGGAVQTSGAALQNDDTNKVAQVVFTAAPAAGAVITVDYQPTFAPVDAGIVKLCTNFTEFTQSFGGFSTDAGQRKLAHAVYGFFNNGGTRCYAVREATTAPLGTSTLPKLAAIDEIAIVAAPGITDAAVQTAIISHCRSATQDRFAIFDSVEAVETSGNLDLTKLTAPANTDYAAFYFPWLQVFDPATKLQDPDSDGLIFMPPSGHIAGIYARVDTERGVHKAPANEVVLGAVGLKYNISKNQQDGLNQKGVNAIRNLNGNIRVWGARTIGGDANNEWRYINVRRLFLFLRKSIDLGTQWVVFEPNDPALWAKITRNITAFLTNVWRAGALFGTTPQEAFYVKCDAELNPPSIRDAGQVVTEIGVAVVKPAEFVIFRISQWAGPGK